MASLIKNTSGQHMKFVLVNASTGAADATGTGLAGKFTIDAGAQASVTGSFTNLGGGQYDYAPVQAETNGTDCGFLFTATGDIPVHMDFHTDTGLLSVDVNGNAAITSNIKKNVLLNGFTFAMTDSTTHQLKTGLSFSAGGSQISKDGGTLLNTANLPTEIGGGLYTINFQQAEMNCNKFSLLFTVSGADPTVFLDLITQP